MEKKREPVLSSPIPIGALLLLLKNNRFNITAEVYIQTFRVLDSSFGQGMAAGTEIQADRELLRLCLRPLIAKSAEEQTRFDELFDAFDDWYTVTEPVKAVENLLMGIRFGLDARRTQKKAERRKKRRSFFRNTMIGTLLIVSCFFVMFINIRHSLVAGIITIQYDYRSQESFRLDSVSRSVPGKVSWVFDRRDSVQKDAGDTVNYDFKTPGIHQVRVDRRVEYQLLLARILGRQQVLLTDSVQVVIDSAANATVQAERKVSRSMPPLNRLAFVRAVDPSDGFSWMAGVLIALITLFAAWLSWLIIRDKIKAPERNTEPPLFLDIPADRSLVRIEPEVAWWTGRLNRREETRETGIDLLKSLDLTVKNNGLPSFVLKNIRRKAQYLFLIDYSPFNQQTDVVKLLLDHLLDQGVDLEVFFFRGDPEYCWNSSSPEGLSLNEISHRFASSKLILVTGGSYLVDYSKMRMQPWFGDTISAWSFKAILYPVESGAPDFIKSILANDFQLFPLTVPGFSALVNCLQGDADSVSEHWRSKTVPGPDMETLTVEVLNRYIGLRALPAEKEALLQWALATTVYARPEWRITLAVGTAVAACMDCKHLLSVRNLLTVTNLPWLKMQEVPASLRERLLNGIYGDCKAAVIEKISGLLHTDCLELNENSFAFQEKRARMLELEVLSGEALDPASRQNLMEFDKGGIIKDTLVQKKLGLIRSGIRIRKLLVAGAVLIMLLLCYWFSWNFRAAIFSVKKTDSAVYYNNLAVDVLEKDPALKNKQTYGVALKNLIRGIGKRPLFEAYYNLSVLKFNLGVSYYNQRYYGRENPVFSARESRDLDTLFAGVKLALKDTNMVLGQPFLESYLQLLEKKAPEADFRKLILTLGVKNLSDSAEAAGPLKLPMAMSAAERVFSRWNLSLPVTGSYRVFDLPVSGLSRKRVDSLVSMISWNDFLYLRKPAPVPLSDTVPDSIIHYPVPIPVPVPVPESTSRMRAHFIDVGQGDATLLEFDCGAILIDAGAQDEAYKQKLITYLQKFFMRRTDLHNTLDLVLVTHSHIDHNYALEDIARMFSVRRYVDNGAAVGSGLKNQKAMEQDAGGKGIAYESFSFEKITGTTPIGMTDSVVSPLKCLSVTPRITVLSGRFDKQPSGWSRADFNNQNNHSLVLKVVYGRASFLFTGDLETPGINQLLSFYGKNSILKADVLRVGFHGAANGLTMPFLDAVNPAYAVISCGHWDYGLGTPPKTFSTFSYGHPSRLVIAELSNKLKGNRKDVLTVKVGLGSGKFTDTTIVKNIYATPWDGNITIQASSAGAYTVLHD